MAVFVKIMFVLPLSVGLADVNEEHVQQHMRFSLSLHYNPPSMKYAGVFLQVHIQHLL